MKEIDVETVKKLQLDMLINFANFCDENNYTYWLSGGTLLGAVRHKGFIPWDDDIDIMMPRDDYEKALKTYKHERYKVDSVLINSESWIHYGRLNDTYTVLKTNYKEECNESVFIDIFPIEGLPDSFIKQRVIYGLSKLLLSCALGSYMTYSASNRYSDRDAGLFNWKYYLRTVIKYIFIMALGKTKSSFWASLLDKIAKKYPFTSSNMAGCVISGGYGTKEIMSHKVFEEKILLDFEGMKFWGLKDYDTYLSHLYGDYMKLPPKEKQVGHHDFIAYYKSLK